MFPLNGCSTGECLNRTFPLFIFEPLRTIFEINCLDEHFTGTE